SFGRIAVENVDVAIAQGPRPPPLIPENGGILGAHEATNFLGAPRCEHLQHLIRSLLHLEDVDGIFGPLLRPDAPEPGPPAADGVIVADLPLEERPWHLLIEDAVVALDQRSGRSVTVRENDLVAAVFADLCTGGEIRSHVGATEAVDRLL